MRYEIDQSIKIENINKPSYVCLANDNAFVISISAKDKKELKLYFRQLSKPLIFKLFTFVALCTIIIIKVKPGTVVVDQEYVGHERQIKSFILQILEIKKTKAPVISFSQIGKSSFAHKAAYKGYVQKKSNAKVTFGEILRYYEKINKK
jgi:hypothetical protein